MRCIAPAMHLIFFMSQPSYIPKEYFADKKREPDKIKKYLRLKPSC